MTEGNLFNNILAQCAGRPFNDHQRMRQGHLQQRLTRVGMKMPGGEIENLTGQLEQSGAIVQWPLQERGAIGKRIDLIKAALGVNRPVGPGRCGLCGKGTLLAKYGNSGEPKADQTGRSRCHQPPQQHTGLPKPQGAQNGKQQHRQHGQTHGHQSEPAESPDDILHDSGLSDCDRISSRPRDSALT